MNASQILVVSAILLSFIVFLANAVFNATMDEDIAVTVKRVIAILFGLNLGLMVGYILWAK